MSSAEVAPSADGTETQASPPRPRRNYWSPRAANSPKHKKGAPSPRTSPKRLPRVIQFSAAVVAFAATVLFPPPGSAAERALPKTRVMKVLDALPIPNHLEGTLSRIAVPANSKTCKCIWRSYPEMGKRLELSPRQVISNAAQLEALDVLVTRRRFAPRIGNLTNEWTLKVPDRLYELAAQYAKAAETAAREAPAVPEPDAGEEDTSGDVDDVDEEELAEIAAARAELLARVAPPAALPPVNAQAAEEPVPEVKAAPAQRPNAEPPPLPRAASQDPVVAAGAILELLRDRGEVYSRLPEPLEAFAQRLAGDLVDDESMPLAQVLIGLWECATLPGRVGQDLADFAVRCCRSVRNLGARSKPVKAILRRAEQGLTGSGPGPPAA